MNAIIYDCEIIKAIPSKGVPPVDGIKYCEGWHDHANMGVSVIGAYDYANDRYRVFLRDNFAEFQALVDSRKIIIGFNSLSFDNRLCAESEGITVPNDKSWDLLVEIWRAAGLGPKFKSPSHLGYSLDAVSEANLGQKKSGNGAMAPVLWQKGQYGEVIDYCLQDVVLTKKNVDRAIRNELINPKTGKILSINVELFCD